MSMQYWSFSTIFWSPRICPSKILSRLMVFFFAASFIQYHNTPREYPCQSPYPYKKSSSQERRGRTSSLAQPRGRGSWENVQHLVLDIQLVFVLIKEYLCRKFFCLQFCGAGIYKILIGTLRRKLIKKNVRHKQLSPAIFSYAILKTRPRIFVFSVFPLFDISGISMDICRKIQKLFICLYGHCPKSALKKMSSFLVLCVKIFCVPVLDTLKVLRNAFFYFLLNKNMEMVGHNCKRAKSNLPRCQYLVQCVLRHIKCSVFTKMGCLTANLKERNRGLKIKKKKKKAGIILLAKKNSALVVAAIADMIIGFCSKANFPHIELL